MNILAFLAAFEGTSLLFWQDRKPITWDQGISFPLLLGGSYWLAQFGYAGDSPLVGFKYGLVLVCFLVALVLVFSGTRLGPVSRFGPSLVRLIGVALVFGGAAIFLNGLWPWVELLPLLPESLGRYRGTACLVSGVIATIFLTVYTVLSQEESARTPWGKLLVVALLLVVTTTVLLYLVVIPHDAR